MEAMARFLLADTLDENAIRRNRGIAREVSMKIGFVGFGEAGSAIAKGLVSSGVENVYAYDIALHSAAQRDAMARRAEEAGVTIAESLQDLAGQSDIILSTVVSTVARKVAEEITPHLRPDHYFVDLNSTSPAVKQDIGSVITATGARFVEAAVMTAVEGKGHKVPLLLCGEAAADLIALLAPLGMNLEYFGTEIGRASATKMFRSIVVKGLEALFLECVLAASRYGVAERVLEFVGEGYPGIDWNELATVLIGRTAIHGERRAHEMEEVANTLLAMGIEPFMAEAAAKRIAHCGRGLKTRFGSDAPKDYHVVMEAIAARDSAVSRS